jgi:hypothetical protein
MIYFASGALRTNADNADQLRAATNAALRANLAIYSVNAGAAGTVNLLPR